jgi:hypothetical protein
VLLNPVLESFAALALPDGPPGGHSVVSFPLDSVALPTDDVEWSIHHDR